MKFFKRKRIRVAGSFSSLFNAITQSCKIGISHRSLRLKSATKRSYRMNRLQWRSRRGKGAECPWHFSPAIFCWHTRKIEAKKKGRRKEAKLLREYCTPGPYFWRLCAFSQKIKRLWTKYPMDLVRNVPRNLKITVLTQ